MPLILITNFYLSEPIPFCLFRNNWLSRNKNGTYVDQSFYSGLPFWTRGAELQPYPLRPLPPRIFYPVPPSSMKFRWDMSHDQLPLFILASRQFTRNPYSARPFDRPNQTSYPALTSGNNNGSPNDPTAQSASNSRRSSVSSGPGETNASNGNFNSSTFNSHAHNYNYRESNSSKNSFQSSFRINIDETEAAAELIQALKDIDLNPNSVPIAESNNSSTGSPQFLSVSTKFSGHDTSRRRCSTGNLTSLSKQSLGVVPQIYIQNSRRHTVANVSPNGPIPRVRTPGVTAPISLGGTMMETIVENEDDEEFDEDDDFDDHRQSISENDNSSKQSVEKYSDEVRAKYRKGYFSLTYGSPGSQQVPTGSNADKASSTAIVPFTPDLPGRVPFADISENEDSSGTDTQSNGGQSDDNHFYPMDEKQRKSALRRQYSN